MYLYADVQMSHCYRSSNEREGTTSATTSAANIQSVMKGCLVSTHPELSRDCDVLLRNDLTDNQKLDLV